MAMLLAFFSLMLRLLLELLCCVLSANRTQTRRIFFFVASALLLSLMIFLFVPAYVRIDRSFVYAFRFVFDAVGFTAAAAIAVEFFFSFQ